jgi:hypothetical protein
MGGDMSPETVSWRALLAGGATAKQDVLIERLEALEAWARSRIRVCEEEIAKHDGTLRLDGNIVATYPEDGFMGRIDQGARIRAAAEKVALETVLRALNGDP